MSEYVLIEQHLVASFADFKLSKEEKYSLRAMLETLQDKGEMLSFTRNKAFDIYRAHYLQCQGEVLEQQGGIDSVIQGLNWLEKVVKTIDVVRAGLSYAAPKALFSPGTECAKQIIDSLHKARASIDICVFTISDNKISEAILSAHEKGRRVRVISDNDKANDRGSDIYHLATQGVPVRLDRSPFHMHHKFALFDRKELLNGSFNWTKSASIKNEENITVLHDASLVDAFGKTFESLWLESVPVGENV